MVGGFVFFLMGVFGFVLYGFNELILNFEILVN